MNVPISPTLAANEEIARRRKHGQQVVNLAFGEAGLPVHPALRDALAQASGKNAYGPVAGSVALREAAAGYWSRRGISAHPDLVVCGPGSKALLYGLLLALGGDVVLPRPSWVSYAAQARLVGVHPIMVAPPPGEGGVPDPELVAAAVAAARARGRTVTSLLVTLPDNPTGRLARPETVRRLAALARELDLTIISDEIYRDLLHDPAATFLSPAEVAPERTVVTTGLSKSLALGGWRIGVARLPETGLSEPPHASNPHASNPHASNPHASNLHGRLLGVASEIWSSPAAPVQHAAAYAFGEPAELVRRVAASRRLHGIVARAVAEHFTKVGAHLDDPQGGFYLYPEIAGFAGSAELAAVLLDRHGVAVLPGTAFGDAPDAARVRVATSQLYGESDEQRTAALHAEDPLELPWIAASLRHLEEALTALRIFG
ncbi:pyridoxal phosphate-dependent aminotransferase [Sphaerimonospora thailandensis]|uniref:Aminotransferase n=1 Tax=Sphaerimonospora thailandensis TaxID=795644 RepID=A0A8J3W176_9ACTN|nr:pyridoxal phosphate-dependent aminotransferase [Sphaerimonospora thailandensis]GIH71838.1 aminopeptidase [Sphaerimonospora thailandensis]